MRASVDTVDGGCTIRHCPIRAQAFDPAWFDDDWRAAQGHGGNRAPAGRGDTQLFEIDGLALVLRRYRRGGFIQRLSRRHYVYTGLERTRSMREFAVLQRLAELQLPAPPAVAAKVHRQGPLYTAALLMGRVPGVTLASLLQATLPTRLWRATGTCLRRFHDAGLWHADLNAHNILIDRSDHPAALSDGGLDVAAIDWTQAANDSRQQTAYRVSLIDFDRARWRDRDEAAEPASTRTGGWRADNLRRLARSLKKVSADEARYTAAADWDALMEGYRCGSSVAAR